MQRSPIVILESTALPNAYPGTAQFISPANTTTTISSASLDNTSALPVAVSITIVAPGGTQAGTPEIVSGLVVPAVGAAPTLLPAIVGQHLAAGGALFIKAATAAVVTARISGYGTTP